MTYNLLNEHEDSFGFTMSSWRPLLKLAEIGGWVPAGTENEDPEWCGTYYSNDGQTVTAADALALASALEAMLDDVPDENTTPNMVTYASAEVINNPVLYDPARYENRREDYGIPPDEPITILRFDQWKPGMPAPTILICGTFDDYHPSPMDYWSGDGKRRIHEFIEFCRKGTFQIY